MSRPTEPPLHTIPISSRPAHGSIVTMVMFSIVFTSAQLGMATLLLPATLLLLIPHYGRKWFDAIVLWIKDGYARLLILIMALFAPTSITITADQHPSLAKLVERDERGTMTRINLPDRLVVMSNHQAYLDWMYIWILAAYSGHARGIVILMKHSLRGIPLVGWAMRQFKFIFLKRSWATDRGELTRTLSSLGAEAYKSAHGEGEGTALLADKRKRSSLWLLIFPEGTITSDEERVKSLGHAKKEGIDDFVSVLHPRTTGLLFSLRALLPQVPDLQLLDITIGYPGVPFGKYPQEWYGLGSVFFRSVPPPTVHMHLHLYSNLTAPDSAVPSLITGTDADVDGLASPEDARAFELWLRGVWAAKEKRLKSFGRTGKFLGSEGGEGAREVIPIRQLKWYHNVAACGGGGLLVPAIVALVIYGIVVAAKR